MHFTRMASQNLRSQALAFLFTRVMGAWEALRAVPCAGEGRGPCSRPAHSPVAPDSLHLSSLCLAVCGESDDHRIHHRKCTDGMLDLEEVALCGWLTELPKYSEKCRVYLCA